MSGFLSSSINGSATNVPDNSGRLFASSYPSQSGAPSHIYQNAGNIQGLHNVHGSFNVPGTIASRNPTLNNIPSGVQQPSGRFASNNLPVALSQLSHGISQGHSVIPNRGGTNVPGNPGFNGDTNGFGGPVPGVLPTSVSIGNRNGVLGMGVSHILGNGGSRMTNSIGNMGGGGNMGRSINSGGRFSMSGLSSRLNIAANAGAGNLAMQSQNRLMGGMLPQGSHQVIPMSANSYPSAAGLSQSHVQGVNNLNSMGMLNEMNSNDRSLFDINNDFPQLTSRPGSAGGPQGQLGSLQKQGLSIQQNQEFSIQKEDFPALTRLKGTTADYSLDLHQKEQFHDDTVPMMQPQHFSMGKSAGVNLGGNISSHHPQQQLLNPSIGRASGMGLRPVNSINILSSGGIDQHIPQYQHQNHAPLRMRNILALTQPLRDSGMNPPVQSNADAFGLLGLLNVIKLNNPDLYSLALGIDLTTLGLNLNSTDNLYKTFASPWSDEPVKGDPEFSLPECYYALQPPALHHGYFMRFSMETLFYIFYSMPKDEAQLYAANELYNRGWFYHKEHRLWFIRIGEPLVKTNTYERGAYHCFDPNTFEIMRKENFVLHYELIEKRPAPPRRAN